MGHSPKLDTAYNCNMNASNFAYVDAVLPLWSETSRRSLPTFAYNVLTAGTKPPHKREAEVRVCMEGQLIRNWFSRRAKRCMMRDHVFPAPSGRIKLYGYNQTALFGRVCLLLPLWKFSQTYDCSQKVRSALAAGCTHIMVLSLAPAISTLHFFCICAYGQL